MRQRALGNTGLRCSELGLGTWGLSGDGYGPVSSDEQDRVIRRAKALGITLFETADVYGRGEMERRLAQILGTDEACLLVTKLGTMPEGEPPRKRFDPSFLNQRLYATTARLQPRQPDVVLLHNPSLQVIVQGEAIAWLSDRAREHAVRGWGVSAGSAAIAMAAIDAGAPIVQLAFNVLWVEDFRAIQQRAREKSVALLARSVLAHGLLCGYWSQDRDFVPEDHRSQRWTGEGLRERIRQLDAIRPLLRGDAESLRSLALRWTLDHELVSSAILGPRSCLQLDQLVRDAGKGPPYLPPDTTESLEARLRVVGARP